VKKTSKKTCGTYCNKVTLITLCFFILSVFSVNDLFAQTSCTGATSVAANPAGACSSLQAITTISVANIAPLATAPCTIRMNGIARERWIQFIPTASTATITGTSTGGASADRQLAMIAYSGACGSLTQIGCANDIPITDITTVQTETIALTGLTAGVPIYIRVISEGNAAGTAIANYNANVCIASTPDNDNPSGAFPLPVSSTSVCSMAQYNNYFATNTNCSPSIPDPSCSTYVPGTSQDVWYSVAVVAPGNLNINNAGQPYGMALYSGTNSPGCGSMTEVICAETGGPANPANFSGLSLTGLATGTYYLRVWKKTAGTSTFSLCATSVPITPPANDNPCGALLATASTNSTCVTSYSTTILGATSSATLNAPTIGCTGLATGAANDDVWAAFTATSTTQQITIQTFTPNTSPGNDFYIALYAASGPTTCPTVSGSELLCSPTNTGVASGLTVGNRYLIRFFNELATAGYSTAINFCVTTPTVATNDECSGAIQASVNPGTSCASSVAGTVFGATASSQTNGCSVGDDDDDVWFFFTASSTSHSITLTTTSPLDLYHSVYAGVCGNIGPAIICGDPNSSVLFGLTPGQNYFVRVYSLATATVVTAATGTFALCVNTPTNTTTCFNPPGNDFCPTATSLSQSPYTFTGTVGAPPAASGIYTSDVPGNLGTVFGGSIEGNSWYSFIAVTPTHTFNIVPSGGCTIQARVLNVALTGSCCTSFTTMSNFYSSSTSGILTATGLTAGVTYYLMVDGLSTANCSFSIPTWVLTSILPLEFVSFTGENEGKKNTLTWITSSEMPHSTFTLEHSANGSTFEDVITLNSMGNAGTNHYSAYDSNPFEDATYYRIKQADATSHQSYSNIISVNLKGKYDNIYNIHPNPTTDNLNFEYYTKSVHHISIELITYAGAVALQMKQVLEEGKNTITLPMGDLNKGVYILKVVSEKSGKTTHHKVIKN
jgi:hypothetical protein